MIFISLSLEILGRLNVKMPDVWIGNVWKKCDNWGYNDNSHVINIRGWNVIHQMLVYVCGKLTAVEFFEKVLFVYLFVIGVGNIVYFS